jgi:hypothetical protein
VEVAAEQELQLLVLILPGLLGLVQPLDLPLQAGLDAAVRAEQGLAALAQAFQLVLELLEMGVFVVLGRHVGQGLFRRALEEAVAVGHLVEGIDVGHENLLLVMNVPSAPVLRGRPGRGGGRTSGPGRAYPGRGSSLSFSEK